MGREFADDIVKASFEADVGRDPEVVVEVVDRARNLGREAAKVAMQVRQVLPGSDQVAVGLAVRCRVLPVSV